MHLTVRPAVLADAPAVCALMNAVDLVEIGRTETDLHSVEADLAHADVDLARDTWLVSEDGELVAFGMLWSDSGEGDIGVDHYVLPGRSAAAVLLLELIEARAAEKAAAAGAARAVLHLHLNARPAVDTALLGARGWRTVRHHQIMTRPLSPAADAVPEPPAGLTLRDCRSEDDRRLAHALVEATFADHFDHHPRTYAQWLEDIGGARLDWSLVWIASLAGEGDVAVVLTRDDREAMGWIRNLGVCERVRGRGIAGHLLRHVFGTYAARGRDTIGLGVDTQNESRALSLYEAHGMTLHYAVDTWEVTLPVTAPTTRTP
ncbi:mycothiol synthase [Streptomyces sp. V4I23]|uniref:GNAT family N-acetyltransferase n=1 Tax=Streptomyces sp. V4I23 TaxID=3042282 RepID=UPI00278AED65|nr:GNAT family N-acetyltransferase [Streptomyces sp. V4I23]MDQ1008491.1 mycothiol synthase [Streptomyces sp. V4I23]